MTTPDHVPGFEEDGSMPEHRQTVTGPFATLATAMRAAYGHHPRGEDGLTHLKAARESFLAAAHDTHTEAGHPGGNYKLAQHAEREPVVEEAWDPYSDTGRAEVHPDGGSSPGADHESGREDGPGEGIRVGEPVTFERTDTATPSRSG